MQTSCVCRSVIGNNGLVVTQILLAIVNSREAGSLKSFNMSANVVIRQVKV